MSHNLTTGRGIFAISIKFSVTGWDFTNYFPIFVRNAAERRSLYIELWTDDSAIAITATQPRCGSREDGRMTADTG